MGGNHLGNGGANVTVHAHQLQERLRLDGIQEPLQLAIADPEFTAG